ncbi:MAG TPA: hypothetical protein VF247_02815, partial [Candidatus Krumholzibacteria bacterium]
VIRWVEHRRRILTPLVFLAVAAALTLHATTFPIENLGPDGHTYEEFGYRAAQSGNLLDCDNFWHAYWSPTWVSAIAGVYHVVGRDVLAVRLLLVGIALATCVLVYFAALELVGYTGAIAAVCLFALSSLVFRFTVYTQYEIPFAFLLFASGFLVFYRVRGVGGRRWGLPSAPGVLDAVQLVAAGIALGLATLTTARGFPMFFILSACFYLKGRWRYVVRALVPLTVGLLLIIIPWTARNHRCYGEWIVATTNGGLNFLVGNNPYAELGYRTPPADVMPAAPRYQSDVYMHAALDYIKAHPGTTAWRVIARMVKFWNPHYADQVVIYLLFFLGLVRMARARSLLDPDRLWLVTLPFMIMAIHAAFYVQVRYVIPALPCIALVAAAALTGWRTPSPAQKSGTKRVA